MVNHVECVRMSSFPCIHRETRILDPLLEVRGAVVALIFRATEHFASLRATPLASQSLFQPSLNTMTQYGIEVRPALVVFHPAECQGESFAVRTVDVPSCHTPPHFVFCPVTKDRQIGPQSVSEM